MTAPGRADLARDVRYLLEEVQGSMHGRSVLIDAETSRDDELWQTFGQLRNAWIDRNVCSNCVLAEHEEHNAMIVWREAATDLVGTLASVHARVQREPSARARELLVRSMSELTSTWRTYASQLKDAPKASERCRGRILVHASDELETATRGSGDV